MRLCQYAYGHSIVFLRVSVVASIGSLFACLLSVSTHHPSHSTGTRSTASITMPKRNQRSDDVAYLGQGRIRGQSNFFFERGGKSSLWEICRARQQTKQTHLPKTNTIRAGRVTVMMRLARRKAWHGMAKDKVSIPRLPSLRGGWDGLDMEGHGGREVSHTSVLGTS